jgi:hypothetical protein
MTKTKRILQVILLLFVAGSIAFAISRTREADSVTSPADVSQGKQPLKHQIIVYYFHGNARCQSCLKIEAYSSDAIKAQFAEQLKTGTLEWRVVNVETAENEHFVGDYKLVTKSVVLVEMNEGKQVQWKNLENVWNFLDNKDRFSEYIKSEVSGYLKGI